MSDFGEGFISRASTVRFDFNITSKHHLENVWNYNVFISTPDQLNSRDSVFPDLPIGVGGQYSDRFSDRSEEHTSELQSLRHLVCRLLLEKKKKQNKKYILLYKYLDHSLELQYT